MSIQRHQTFRARQEERTKVLHRACLSIQAAIQRGQQVGRAIRRVAARHHGRQFKADPARRLAMSPKSLRRFWDAWKCGGELPAAFAQHYQPHRRFIPASLLIRFAEFCASQAQPSFSAAWRNFSARGGSFGQGRRAGKPVQISFFVLRQYFPVAAFYQLQGELKAISASQTRLGQVKLNLIAEIRRRLPDRPPRQRGKRQPEFEI